MASEKTHRTHLSSAAFGAAIGASVAANARFNSLAGDLETTDRTRHEAEMKLLGEATRRADKAEPTTWQEYTRLLEHMTDNGLSQIDDDNATRLLDHARRLAATNPSPLLSALITAVAERNAAVSNHQRKVLDRPGFAQQDQSARMAQIVDNNELNQELVDAMDAVASFPASTADDLHAKLAYMVDNNMGDGVDWLPEILADVERITSRTAAPEWDAAVRHYERTTDENLAAGKALSQAEHASAGAAHEGSEETYAAAEARQGETCDTQCAAIRALVALPAPHAAAVLVKLQIALDTGMITNSDLSELVTADLRRFSNYANREA